MIKGTEGRRIKTNNLLALCEIGEDYKTFCEDLESLMKSKKVRGEEVYHAMQKNVLFGKYKSFREKHKRTIDIMNKYLCLSNFIIFCFSNKGDYLKNNSNEYFYRYLLEHKEDIETIKEIVLKIKELKIDNIVLDENLDFAAQEYTLWDYFGGDFAFLENIEIIPTAFLDEKIKYQTSGSCYCLHFSFFNRSYLHADGRSIELNSLVFNPARLPNILTFENTLEVILNLAKDKRENYEDLKNAICLSAYNHNLREYFKSIKKLLEKMNKLKNNQDTADLTMQIQNTLEQIQLFENDLEREVMEAHPDITEDIIKREKKKYLESVT